MGAWYRRLGWPVALVALACASADTADLDRERAERALVAGRFEDAADAYRAALALQPSSREALVGLARSYVGRGEGEAALAVFAELERVDAAYLRERASTEYHFALYQAARSRLGRGDPAGALQVLRHLRALAPEHAGLHSLLPRVLIAEAGRLQAAGRPEDAAALLREATGSSLSGAPAAAVLAGELLEIDEVDTAITVLSDALRQHPDDDRLRALIDLALDIRYPDAP